MKKTLLDGKWSLRGRSELGRGEEVRLTAEVPGCVFLDLSREGYLPADLYYGENIKACEKYEEYVWEYEREFEFSGVTDNAYLVFYGVDCVAEYFLNGKKIGESRNALVEHEFFIADILIVGKNTLTVKIASTVMCELKAPYDAHALMSWHNYVGATLRRAPHTYGWDIMPRAVSAAIWRSVVIEERDEIYVRQIYVKVTESRADAYIELSGVLPATDGLRVVLSGSCYDSQFRVSQEMRYTKSARVSLNIENPKKWMPYGYGDANVYDSVAEVYIGDRLISEKNFSFGLRTVALERTDEAERGKGCFRFRINGVDIMAKGSNWVPLDAFHSRDSERYGRALSLVCDIGCNILRCWGGNVYEDEEFFDFCDRNGIMVWQDFAMACRTYPRTDEFRRDLTYEVEKLTARLRNHPSLVLWAGDNESDEMVLSMREDPQRNVITREWLPELIRRYDLDTPYLPSSPYVAPGVKRSNVAESHQWGPRDYFKSDFYKNNEAHFVSETGYHGCPSEKSIRKFISPEKVWPYKNNSEWILHSTDFFGNDTRVMLMEKQVRVLFGEVPEDMDNYILASQISQAEADKFFIERMRVDRPNRNGIIWWNLLDGWPQMSDAVVDYYFEKKLAYDYIKRSEAPFAVIADEPKNDKIALFACNDTLDAVCGTLSILDGESGEELLVLSFEAGSNTSTKIVDIDFEDDKVFIFKWSTEKGEGINHYLSGDAPHDFEKYKNVLKKWKL